MPKNMKKKPRKNKKPQKKGGVKKSVKKAKPRKEKKPVKRVKKSTRRVKKPRPKFRPAKRITGKRKIRPVKIRIYVGKGTLEQLFESQAKTKLLKFFFRNCQDSFTLKEILKRLRTNAALIRKELGKLEKLGLIKQKKIWLSFEKKRGGVKREQKTVYYISSDFDFYNELKNLILKSTIASKDELTANVKKIGNIKILALSGIFTGDEAAKADILIVGDKINPRKLNTFIKDLEAEVGKELNCAAMSTREFNYRYDMYDRFVRDLLAGKSEVLINRVNLW